jgi:Fur family peroxide stress response transcriptional regulator
MKGTADILKDKGLKVTPQRLAIYTCLRNSYSHPTAEDIYKEVVVSNPSISLATVYKTLDSFSKVGLVNELHIVNEHSNYDAHMEQHSHLICSHCQKIFDYTGSSLSSLSDAVAKESGFDIQSSCFTFYGICPECKNK